MSLKSPQRIVIKFGTNVVTASSGGLVRDRISALVEEIVVLMSQGKEILLVSSGAVGLGRQVLGDSRSDLPYRQSCAAVGQNILMSEYRELFAKHGITVAQVLVTSSDLSDRSKYLDLRNMLNELIKLKVLPIINENDSVSTMELVESGKEKSFGDNDRLSALMASKVESDLLVLLTDVEAIFDKSPKKHSDAIALSEVKELSDLDDVASDVSSGEGRGGIDSKIEAVRLASMSGVYSVVASGHLNGVIQKALGGETGTLVHPTGKVSARRKWIGFSSGVSGVLSVNEGAQKALESSSASLLAVGIVAVADSFKQGDTVSIEKDGVEIGRGIVGFTSEEIAKIQGRKNSEIADILGKNGPEEVIHRDRLVIFSRKES